jgi:hypothetical protein
MTFEGGAKGGDAVAVMGPVEEEGAVAALEDLEAAGPTDAGEAFGHLFVRDREEETEGSDGGGSEGGVGALVFAQKG